MIQDIHEYIKKWMDIGLNDYEVQQIIGHGYFASCRIIPPKNNTAADHYSYYLKQRADEFSDYVISRTTNMQTIQREDGSLVEEIRLVVMEQADFLKVMTNLIKFLPIEVINELKNSKP